MNNLNKITHTRVGDNIHYFTNGQEGRGTVVKMNNAYVSVLKDSGVIDEIHINDTFFIKDIITIKSWNDMDLEERVVELQKAHAFSPRFISKTWEDLPQELRDVLLKTNLEETTLGQLGGNRAGVSTDTDVKAPETLDSTVFKSEAIDADVDVNAPETLVSTVLILLCNALADAFKLCDTADGVAKLPLTDAAVAYPLPAVIVIEPSTERLVPSQVSLSPKLNFPPLSKKNGVFELPCVPVP